MAVTSAGASIGFVPGGIGGFVRSTGTSWIATSTVPSAIALHFIQGFIAVTRVQESRRAARAAPQVTPYSCRAPRRTALRFSPLAAWLIGYVSPQAAREDPPRQPFVPAAFDGRHRDLPGRARPAARRARAHGRGA